MTKFLNENQENQRDKENQKQVNGDKENQKQSIRMPKVREFLQEKDLQIKLISAVQEEESIEPQQFFF